MSGGRGDGEIKNIIFSGFPFASYTHKYLNNSQLAPPYHSHSGKARLSEGHNRPVATRVGVSGRFASLAS